MHRHISEKLSSVKFNVSRLSGSLVVTYEAIIGAFLYLSLLNAPKFVSCLTNDTVRISIAKTYELILIKKQPLFALRIIHNPQLYTLGKTQFLAAV